LCLCYMLSPFCTPAPSQQPRGGACRRAPPTARTVRPLRRARKPDTPQTNPSSSSPRQSTDPTKIHPPNPHPIHPNCAQNRSGVHLRPSAIFPLLVRRTSSARPFAWLVRRARRVQLPHPATPVRLDAPRQRKKATVKDARRNQVLAPALVIHRRFYSTLLYFVLFCFIFFILFFPLPFPSLPQVERALSRLPEAAAAASKARSLWAAPCRLT